MKYINLCFIFLVSLLNIKCGEASPVKEPAPAIKFAELKFKNEKAELGIIDGNAIANYDFSFANTGNAPLTITEVKGNCHCVQGKWPEKSIEPGDSSVINVSFDPKGVTGLFIRTLMVQSNATKQAIELVISGEIKADPKKNARGPGH